MSAKLYTIGHSNHSSTEFLQLLMTHGIDVLIDVRSQPYSKYCPQFNTRALQSMLPPRGIQYLFLGDQLGGRPSDEQYYDAAGHVLYHRIAESSAFRSGVERLREESDNGQVAMMCSEENPIHCHRFLLVTKVVAQLGFDVYHIRGDGSMDRDAVLRAASGRDDRQKMLFDELGEDKWRSPRSLARSTVPRPDP